MTPNYIDIIRWYWDEVPEMDGYKADYTALFFALLDSINRNNWQETEIEYDRIMYKCPLNKRTYLEGRKWLRDNQIILLKEGRGEYAKARFMVHNAVFDVVQERTAKRTAKRTASTPHRAPIYNSKPIKPIKPLNLKDEESKKKIDDDDFENKNLSDWAKKEKEDFRQAVEEMQKESPPSSAAPPPLNRADYEKHLLGMTSAKEQMGRILKLYNDTDYQELVNVFLSEKIDEGKTWKDCFDCGSNFRNWIPYYAMRQKPITTKNGNTGASYQPTRKPNYQTAILSRDDDY